MVLVVPQQGVGGTPARSWWYPSRVLVVPQQTMSSPAPIMILPVQRKLVNLADVPSTLSLPSEEQYSKCTYPLCSDFSQCPLTQPFHIFVYNHHFRNLFNLKYPATVDSFVTQSSHLTF